VGKRLHGRVGGDDFGHRQVFFHHVAVGDIRSGFSGTEDETGVLHREKSLGDKNVTGNRQCQRQAEHADHQFLVGEGTAQTLFVPGQQAFAEARFVVGVVHRFAHE